MDKLVFVKEAGFICSTGRMAIEIKVQKYFKLAKVMADMFSKDPDTKVGCLLLEKESYAIKSQGFNGIPRKVVDYESERWARPNKYNYVTHAEANAICNAARIGTPINDSIAVITLFPCNECAKILIQAGITMIVCPAPDYNNEKWGESFKVSMEMFEEVGMCMIYL